MNNSPESAYDAESIHPSNFVSSTPGSVPDTSEANNPPWGILAALVTWFVSIAMIAVVPNVCVLPYLVFRYDGSQPPRELLLQDQTFVFLFVLGWLPAHLLTLALVWAIGTRLGKRSMKQVFCWSWSPNFGFWKSSALATALFLVTLVLIGLFGGPRTDLDRILESSRAAAVTLAIIAVVTAPLVEELIYRGLLYSAFQRVLGQWPAVLIVASMFAGLHVIQYWPNAGAISSIALLSLVLTFVRARTGRILPCFVIHLVFNGVQSVIIIVEPYLRLIFEQWRHEPVNTFIVHLARLIN